MFPARNISLEARADRQPARRRIIERKAFQRAEGWIARRGDFSLPAFVCFFGAFFSQEKKAEFLKRKKERSIALQIRRFAGDWNKRKYISARKKTSSVGSADTFPRGEGKGLCKSADLQEMGNAKETDCRAASLLGVTIAGNAHQRFANSIIHL